MTDQEKNEVLAKWAGFTEKKFRAPVCTHKPRCTYWVDPDGKDTRLLSDPNGKRLPDFLHSLDVQAKWLWPKLGDWGMYKLENMVVFAAFTKDHGDWVRKRATTPAEACAEAVLSLISA